MYMQLESREQASSVVEVASDKNDLDASPKDGSARLISICGGGCKQKRHLKTLVRSSAAMMSDSANNLAGAAAASMNDDEENFDGAENKRLVEKVAKTRRAVGRKQVDFEIFK